MTTYNRLKLIIPEDQALANKALQAGLEQVKTIFNLTLPNLTSATVGLETTQGLSIIDALTEPLPANVYVYFTNTFATGSGPDGILLLTDVIGTPTGWIDNDALSNVTGILNTMTTEGDFNTLTNPSTGVYTIMENTIAGNYTIEVTPPDPGPPPTPGSYLTTIPSGLPGAGSYTGDSIDASIQSAFDGDGISTGLTAAYLSAVNAIVAANSAQVTATTTEFNSMCEQILRENTNLAAAGIVFADLPADQQPWSLVYNLPSDGLDTVEGGSAYVLQSLAVQSTQGGQAIIATMRQARNQQRLGNVGIDTDILLSSERPEPQAPLSTGEYSATDAAAQKII